MAVSAAQPAPRTPSDGDVKLLWVTSYSGLAGFLQLEQEWRSLSNRCGTTNPFLTWEWVSEWGAAFWRGRLLTMVVRSSEGAVAIAPFFVDRRLISLGRPSLQLMGPRRLRHLFEVGEALVDPGYAVEALDLLLQHVSARGRWSWIEVTACGPGIAAWKAAVAGQQVAMLTRLEERTNMPVMRFEENWERVWFRLRRNVKESIRHAYNSLPRTGKVFSYNEYCDSVRLQAVLADFFTLHTARSTVPHKLAHADYFSDDHARDFLVRAAVRMVHAGVLRVGAVEIDGRRVAIRLNLEINGMLYLYYSGFDPAFWGQGIMTLALTESFKSAVARGLTAVNFSPGIDQAKARWDVTSVPLARFWFIRNDPRSRLHFATHRGASRLRRRWQTARRR